MEGFFESEFYLFGIAVQYAFWSLLFPRLDLFYTLLSRSSQSLLHPWPVDFANLWQLAATISRSPASMSLTRLSLLTSTGQPSAFSWAPSLAISPLAQCRIFWRSSTGRGRLMRLWPKLASAFRLPPTLFQMMERCACLTTLWVARSRSYLH